MKTKGGRKGKFSAKRMASMPRPGKVRPKSRGPHHLTPYERLALLAARRKEREERLLQPSPAAAPPPAAAAAAAVTTPPSLLAERLVAERLVAWARRSAATIAASAYGASRRVLHLAAAPWVGLAGGIRAAFAPVRAEGERHPGSMPFHGLQRQAAAAAPAIPASTARPLVQIALTAVPARGDDALPDDLSALAYLLGESLPADDFKASDLVRDCFAPFGSAGLPHRALLAVAIRLTAEFGLPTRLPLASGRAWRMLDPSVFEEDMAAQLAAISTFISDWQKTQQSFLCLEFPEIDLIEWLFECLHPGRHSDLLFEVMNFKVLSNRRQGILRRIPHRVRKMAKDMGGEPEAILYAAGAHAYLERVATSHGFTPIVETAAACLEEVNKVLERLAPPPALPDASGAEGGALPLARISPVKMPASELAGPAPSPLAPPRPPSPPVASPPVQQAQPLAARPLPPAQPVPPLAPPAPPAVPAIRPAGEGVRPATVRLLPKHIRAGAELTIPSRSAGRIPLGRMFSCDGTEKDAARPARTISVRSEQTRAGMKPTRFPGPVDAIIPSGPARPAPEAEARPAPAPAPRAVTGRVTLPRPVPPQPAPAAQKPPGPVLAIRPKPPAEAAPQAPVVAENVTKLTVVQKRRLPITQALKRQSVMRVLRGEDPEQVAQSIGIGRPKLDEWVDKFVAAGAGALSSGRKRKSEELSVDTLRAKLAEVLATAQLIEQVMEASLPRRPMLLPPPAGQESPPPPPARRPPGQPG
jgi:hypothetical protein